MLPHIVLGPFWLHYSRDECVKGLPPSSTSSYQNRTTLKCWTKNCS